MGLILCEKNEVTTPFYISDLGVNIYSLEELCYIIHEYPLLVLDGFVTDTLVEFLVKELKLGMYFRQMEKNTSRKLSDEEILVGLLEYSDLYSRKDVAAYRERIQEIRNMTEGDYFREKGDFMFNIGRYGQALRYYGRAEKAIREKTNQKRSLARIYTCMGHAQANLLQTEDAFGEYVKAYETYKEESTLKFIYFLSRIEKRQEKKDRYLAYLGERVNQKWDVQYEAALNHYRESAEYGQLNIIFDKDSVRRKQMTADLLSDWKQKYRSMV